MTTIWVIDEYPASVADDGDAADRPFHFEPPQGGAVFRVVQSTARPPGYDADLDSYRVSEHPPQQTPGGTWERGGQNLYTTRIHKSRTLDFGILMSGRRTLVLDGGEYELEPGDIVIQIGSWHSWANREEDSLMAFVMMGGVFAEDPFPQEA